MWTDAEGEVFVGAISAEFPIRLSRDELEGAKTRSELKRVWIDNAALLQIRSSVGEVQYKMAYKLSQTREEDLLVQAHCPHTQWPNKVQGVAEP